MYARSSKKVEELEPRVQRGHHPAPVMVWWGVKHDEMTDIHFCEKEKTSEAVYHQTVLEGVSKQLGQPLFQNEP